MKNNFTQALKDLTGFGESEVNEEKTVSNTEIEMDAAKEVAATFAAEMNFDEDVDVEFTPVVIPEYSETVVTSVEKTIITDNMVITGDIISSDNIHISGKVFGKVSTTANVTLKDARVNCDFKVDGNITVGDNTIVVGNISCENATISGKIKGNLDAEGSVNMSCNSLILGDIMSERLQTETGAKISGRITPRNQNINFDEEDEFDLGGDF